MPLFTYPCYAIAGFIDHAVFKMMMMMVMLITSVVADKREMRQSKVPCIGAGPCLYDARLRNFPLRLSGHICISPGTHALGPMYVGRYLQERVSVRTIEQK